MKSFNFFRIITGVLLVFLLSIIAPSCAVHSKKINTQKRGLMIQDKSQYSKNKKHFKGSKAHKAQKKRQRKSF